MRKLLAATAMGVALIGSVATATAADAQRWRGGGYYGRGYGGYGRGYYRGHGNGAAVAAGIIGLGVGAAIASSNRGYYGGGYRGYYGYGPGYGPGPAYYGPPPGAYYGCHTSLQWDGWIGDYRPVRVCY